MKKRFLTVFLALALCMGLAVPAFAASSDFEIENGVLNKYRGSGGNVTIPAGITTIGEDAFAFCKDLTSITIPSSVTRIESGAFLDCKSLNSVTIPSSITDIGDFAFNGTPWLASQGEFGIVNGVLQQYYGPGGNVVIPSNVTRIGGFVFEEIFNSVTSVTSVTIPSSVISIGSNAFAGCGLTSITIPDSVTTIEVSAFLGCDNLTTVTFGSGLKEIGESAFRFCASLTSIVLPDGLTAIGNFAFHGCDNLKSITIPSSVTDIAWGTFSTHINSADYVIIPGLTIYSKAGSYAEHYAKENGIPFVAEGEPPKPDTPAEPTTPTFTDLLPWCAKEAQWAVEQGITNGAGSTTTFLPMTVCDHSQILTFLWRASGKPETAQAPVTVASYYQDAINWAYEKGMIDESFQSDTPCTRAQAVTYIWQAKDKPQAAEAAGFPDVAEDASYIDAVNWAAEKGVTGGDQNGNFAPDRVCTRGEIVTFLYRAYH